jgi:hypothetical protein
MAEPVCPECHKALPRGALKASCESCLNRRYTHIMLGREREVWAYTPPEMVDLSPAQKPKGDAASAAGWSVLLHIVLAVDSTRTYCGRSTRGPLKSRGRMAPRLLPDSVCTDCRKVFDEVQRLAGEVRSGKGVAT